jgi:hypothetical protein
MPQGFPVSPLRDWIWLSRSCTCRGLVMYLSYTCAGNAPDDEARDVRSLVLWARYRAVWRGSGLRNRGGGHLQRLRYRPGPLDRGGSSHLIAIRSPAAGPMCPRIKSPLLHSIILLELLSNNASTCRELSFCPIAGIRGALRIPGGASPYRGIRATMEQPSVRIGLDHHGRGRLRFDPERP